MSDNDIVSKINQQKSNSPTQNSQLSTQHDVSCDTSGKMFKGFGVDLYTRDGTGSSGSRVI